MKDSHTTFPDGRKLTYTEIGDPAGIPCFYFHGAPTSRLSLVPFEVELARRGLRALSADRPGYGGSSPQPDRSMADWPTDVERLADALGVGRFAVAGYSSGGPYAVACAALLQERVSGALVLAGVTDFGWAGAPEGYFDAEVEMMRLPDEKAVAARCTELYGADGRGLLESSDMELSEPDMRAFSDEKVASALVASMSEAFRQGVGGYAQDIFVQGRPWPFEPGRIAVPVIVAHGNLDAVVPLAHGRHTAALIPGAELRILPGHGHLSIASELPGLLAGLAARVEGR